MNKKSTTELEKVLKSTHPENIESYYAEEDENLYDEDKKHVGVYIGYYSEAIPYAVIEASSYDSPLTDKNGVQPWNYYDTQLTAYYCEYDFIDLNLTYEQTKERRLSMGND